MSLILYLPRIEGPGKELYQTVKRAALPEKLERYRSINDLSHRLQRPIFDVNAAVLLATDQNQLQSLISLGDFIVEMRIILVLPDHDPDTIAQGHLLRPRFITWLDDNLSHVGIFLKKMLSLYVEPVRPPVRKIIRTPLTKSLMIANKKT